MKRIFFNENYSYCIGCGKSFSLDDPMVRTIGSPEFETICHIKHCGNAKECKECSVYKNKMVGISNSAIKGLFNVLCVSIASLSDDQLASVEGVVVNLAPIVAAEIDKRNGDIKDYKCILKDKKMTMKIVIG